MLEFKEYKKYDVCEHMKVYLDGEHCGDLIIEYTKSDNIYVHMLRVLKKFRRQGIARKMVEFADKLYPSAIYIGGDSKPNDEAMGFWKSVGAEFVRDSDELVEKQELVPFMIFKNK